MKHDHPNINDDSLAELLNDLSFAPTSLPGAREPADNIAGSSASTRTNVNAASHQAPVGLRRRILAELNREVAQKLQYRNRIAQWLLSPWRAVAACAAPLLLGVLLGTTNSSANFYGTSLDPLHYPDNDRLLVIAGLDSDFTETLGQELPQYWAQDGESATVPAFTTSPDMRPQGVTTP